MLCFYCCILFTSPKQIHCSNLHKKMSTERTGRKSSFIWNFFSASSNERACCRICGKSFSRKGCCTSGLITHFKKMHTDTFLQYLNKGTVSINGEEVTAVKKEAEEHTAPTRSKRGRKAKEAKYEESDSQSSTSERSFKDSAEPPHKTEEDQPIEQMCLQEDEYPIINIEGKNDNPFQPPPTSQMGAKQIESLLTKQLQIQAKLYKEMKEKLEQISTHLRESERLNRKRYRLKAEKLRILKEELKQKELHRKEMHRLRLLELEILNKKNVQDQLHYNSLQC